MDVTAKEMAEAAGAWLTSLTDQERQRAVFPGMTGERTTWYFTPTDHGGLPLNEQRPHQQRLAMRLVATGLSPEGYTTAATVMGLENVLDRVEGWGRSFGRERGRDPGMYYLSVFGTPGAGEWGWRFGGHHISLNYTLNDGRLVSSTPCFLGANPARTELLAGGTLQPLGGIESGARTLAASLLGRGHTAALLHPVATSDIISGNRERVLDGDELLHRRYLWRHGQTDGIPADGIQTDDSSYRRDDHHALAITAKPKGVPGAELAPDERVLLLGLVGGYLGRFPASFRESWLERYLTADGLDGLHFGYAGQPDDAGVYYRLQDDRLLIEYDNTQSNANHAHTVVRDLAADFGGPA
jgi:hypothetical protein